MSDGEGLHCTLYGILLKRKKHHTFKLAYLLSFVNILKNVKLLSATNTRQTG